MTLEISIILYSIEVAPRLGFVFRGIPTDGAAEIKNIHLGPLKLLKTRRHQTNKFRVNKIH